jgi:hypothetical protein
MYVYIIYISYWKTFNTQHRKWGIKILFKIKSLIISRNKNASYQINKISAENFDKNIQSFEKLFW